MAQAGRKNSGLYGKRDTSEYQKEYRQKNPEKFKQYKITAAIRFLTENGYTVTEPTELVKGDADNA